MLGAESTGTCVSRAPVRAVRTDAWGPGALPVGWLIEAPSYRWGRSLSHKGDREPASRSNGPTMGLWTKLLC